VKINDNNVHTHRIFVTEKLTWKFIKEYIFKI